MKCSVSSTCTVQYITVQYSTVLYEVLSIQHLYSTVQYCMKCSVYSTCTVQYSTVLYEVLSIQHLYSTVQYSTVQYYRNENKLVTEKQKLSISIYKIKNLSCPLCLGRREERTGDWTLRGLTWLGGGGGSKGAH